MRSLERGVLLEDNKRSVLGPRVAIVADGRETCTIREIFKFCRKFPHLLQPAGFVVPAGELDNGEFIRIAQLVETPGAKMTAITQIDERDQDMTFGTRFISSFQDFTFAHAPYEQGRLKDEGYRKSVSERLLEVVEAMHPDIVILANLKLFLDPVFVNALEGRLYNIHPSVLPLLKGYRPEHKASNLRQSPEAAGWTIHQVVPAMDRGSTVAQQRIPVELLDEKRLERMSDYERKVYFSAREERLRLQIIRSEAQYLPRILAMLAARNPNNDEPAYARKEIGGDEAFDAEGRPGFETSDQYSRLVADEGDNAQPYRRLLFDIGSGFKTAEKLLDIQPISSVPATGPIKRWLVRVYGHTTWDERRRFQKSVDGLLGGELVDFDSITSPDRSQFSVTTSASVESALSHFPERVVFAKEEEILHTSVTSPRDPVEMTYEEGEFDPPDWVPKIEIDLIEGTLRTELGDDPAVLKLEEIFDVRKIQGEEM